MNKKTMIRLYASIIAILVLSAYSTAQVAHINAGNIKQTIDGFGASTAWHGQLSDQEADAAFKNDTDNQMGLSILRIRIDENGNLEADDYTVTWYAKNSVGFKAASGIYFYRLIADNGNHVITKKMLLVK